MSGTWPEQDACEKWWRERRVELKEAVSAYRLQIESKKRELEAENARLREALEFAIDFLDRTGDLTDGLRRLDAKRIMKHALNPPAEE